MSKLERAKTIHSDDMDNTNLVRSRANEDEVDGNLRVGAPITLGLLSYI